MAKRKTSSTDQKGNVNIQTAMFNTILEMWLLLRCRGVLLGFVSAKYPVLVVDILICNLNISIHSTTWRVIHDTCVLSKMQASLIVKLPVHKELFGDAPHCLHPSPGPCHAPLHFRISFIYTANENPICSMTAIHISFYWQAQNINYKNGIDFIFFTPTHFVSFAKVQLVWIMDIQFMQRSFEDS